MIELVPYDPSWPREVARLRAALLEELAGLEVTVEHVGSTAVPGLIAKPILDVDIVFRGATTFEEVRSGLAAVGYAHRGDQGIPGREAFRQDEDGGPTRLGNGRWPRHHLYVCHQGGAELARHLAFRDALRADSSLAAHYAELKRQLAREAGEDREWYSESKSGFVHWVLSASLQGGTDS